MQPYRRVLRIIAKIAASVRVDADSALSDRLATRRTRSAGRLGLDHISLLQATWRTPLSSLIRTSAMMAVANLPPRNSCAPKNVMLQLLPNRTPASGSARAMTQQ